jgi:hypothetical protein
MEVTSSYIVLYLIDTHFLSIPDFGYFNLIITFQMLTIPLLQILT